MIFRFSLILLLSLSITCKKNDNSDKNKKNTLIGLALLSQPQQNLEPGGTICAGSTNESYYSFADGLVQAAASGMNRSFSKKSTNGSIENAMLMASGVCNMAIVQEDIFAKLLSYGKTDSTYLKTAAKMNIIAALYLEDVQIIVNKNSGINTISDIAGKKVNIGPLDSATQITANTILSTYSFTNNLPIYSNYNVSESITKVVNGELDAAFLVATVPTPSLTALPSTANIKLISAKFNEGSDTYIYSHGNTILAKTYPWHTTDLIDNIKINSLLVVNNDFDDSKIENFLRAIYDNSSNYVGYNPNWIKVSEINSQDYFGISPYQWNYKAAAYSIGTNKRSFASLKICSGTTTGTYTLIAQDLIPVFSSSANLTVTEDNTSGSLENAFKLRDGDCSFGIVQEDTFNYVESYNMDDYRIISPSMKKLMTLYKEDVHILVNTSSGINSVIDFSGKKVNLGEKTSGSFVTARNIISSYKFSSQPIYSFDDTNTSVDKVVAGTIDATIIVGVAPISKLASLPATAPVKLIKATTNAADNSYDTNGIIKSATNSGTYLWHTTDLTNNLQVTSVLVKSSFGLSDSTSANLVSEIYSKINKNEFTKAQSIWNQVKKSNTLDYIQKNPFSFSPSAFDFFVK